MSIMQDEDLDEENQPSSRAAALRRRLTKNHFITVPIIVSALLFIAGLALVTVRPDKQVHLEQPLPVSDPTHNEDSCSMLTLAIAHVGA